MAPHSDTFVNMIEAHKGIIYKVAHSYCREQDDRKDLIQEIIIQIWRSFQKYNTDYKASTWIYRIALNVSISYYRKNKNRNEKTSQLSEIIFHLAYEEEEHKQNEKLDLLQKFIRELRELDRALMLLHLDGKNHNEISEIMGISTTNISTKISRIKNQLKLKFSSHKITS